MTAAQLLQTGSVPLYPVPWRISPLDGTIFWPALYVAVSTLVAAAALVVWRIYASPASNIPGPAMAGATAWYELYHWLVKDDWYEHLQDLHDRYGPVVRVGPNEVHFVDHQFCLRLHNRADLLKCPTYYRPIRHLLGGITDPQRYRQRKALMKPLFRGETLSVYASGTMNNLVEALQVRLLSGAGRGPTNLTHLLWAFSADIMTSYISGEAVGLGKLEGQALVAAHEATRPYGIVHLAAIAHSVPLLMQAVDAFPALKRLTVIGWADKLASTYLTSWGKGESKEKSQASRNNLGIQLADRLKDKYLAHEEMTDIILAGAEGLLSNLIFLIHHMAQSPRTMDSLRAELDNFSRNSCHGRQVWKDSGLIQLEYLDAVVRETTRLSAPWWHRLPRQSSTPVTYKEQVIPAKVSMSFTLRMLERDPTIFPDPEMFIPERWLHSNPDARRLKATSVTFGVGNRICLGYDLSQQVLKKALACIVQELDFTICVPEGGPGYLGTYPTRNKAVSLVAELRPRSV
ncbi:cytochrome P450 [Apiospora kogelbergensis]|uniref:cytochrome P450 n=1 Tax=Apiospora kogelbergensis TaxID=1337665 RepID=UPI00312E7CCC